MRTTTTTTTTTMGPGMTMALRTKAAATPAAPMTALMPVTTTVPQTRDAATAARTTAPPATMTTAPTTAAATMMTTTTRMTTADAAVAVANSEPVQILHHVVVVGAAATSSESGATARLKFDDLEIAWRGWSWRWTRPRSWPSSDPRTNVSWPPRMVTPAGTAFTVITPDASIASGLAILMVPLPAKVPVMLGLPAGREFTAERRFLSGTSLRFWQRMASAIADANSAYPIRSRPRM
jgi:hypothetical protein